MAILITNTFVNALSRVMRKAYFTTVEKIEEFYPVILNVEEEGKGSRPFVDEMTLVGFGFVPEKPQTTQLAYDKAYEGFVTRYVYTTFALGYRVSKEMMLEDALGIIPQLPKALAYAARQSVENKVWNILNFGFTAGVTAADGVTLFNSAHPLRGGGTFSNTATAATLSVTALQNAIVNAFDLLVDDRNLPIVRTAKYLVVPPQLEKTALEIIKSAYTVGSPNNEINVQYERLQVVSSRYLTSPTAWFVLGNRGPLGSDAHALKVIWRWKDNFEQDKDFDTKTIKNSLDYRFTFGWTDWRATYGNPGV